MMNCDIWQKCRTCLREADELVPLNSACDVDESTRPWIKSNETNGDLLTECTDVQFNPADGLPPNICVECAAALIAAFAYKRMSEQSDAKLREIFLQRCSSARVKIERVDDNNDNSLITASNAVQPLEEPCSDVLKIETFDECWQNGESEDGDAFALPIPSSENSEKDNSTNELVPVEKKKPEKSNNRTKRKPISKRKKKTHNEKGEGENVKCENGRLKCEICNISFLNSRTLKNHCGRFSHLNRYNQLHGSGEGVVKCSRKPVEKMKKKIRTKVDADEDAKIAERAQCVNGRFICEFCNNSFAERISLKFHIRIHLGINLKKCPFCNRGFSRQGHLQQHIKINHSKNSPCPQCDQVFDSREELRLHSIDAHKVPKPEKAFACDICSRVFNRTNNLTEHRLTHSREKNFSCDICQRKYSTKRGIKDHMRTHGDIANYYQHLCSHCGKKFATTSHMAKHIRSKHTIKEPFKCEYCGKAFVQHDALKKHILKHLDRFICKICGKSLSTKFRLISHTRIHTGEKPHRCSVCNEAFSQAKTLKHHLRGHGDAVPNRCNICDDVFTHPRWLEIHRRQFEHHLPTN